jgi:hypothetical protein
VLERSRAECRCAYLPLLSPCMMFDAGLIACAEVRNGERHPHGRRVGKVRISVYWDFACAVFAIGCRRQRARGAIIYRNTGTGVLLLSNLAYLLFRSEKLDLSFHIPHCLCLNKHTPLLRRYSLFEGPLESIYDACYFYATTCAIIRGH